MHFRREVSLPATPSSPPSQTLSPTSAEVLSIFNGFSPHHSVDHFRQRRSYSLLLPAHVESLGPRAMRDTKFLPGTSNSNGPMPNPSTVGRSICRCPSCAAELAFSHVYWLTRAVKTLLALTTTGGSSRSLDTVLIRSSFLGLCCERKTERRSTLHRTKEQERSALNSALVPCRLDFRMLVKCARYSTRPCSLRSCRVRAFRRNTITICFSTPSLPNGARSQMSVTRGTLPSCKVMAMGKLSFNAGKQEDQ